jgi:hypothetical protein
MWWGRPFVYALTIPVCLPAALPGLTAAGGSGGTFTTTLISRGELFRKFIGPQQKELLKIAWNQGRIPKGLTKQSVEAYIEIARRSIVEGIDKGEQIRRLGILQELLKRMK